MLLIRNLPFFTCAANYIIVQLKPPLEEGIAITKLSRTGPLKLDSRIFEVMEFIIVVGAFIARKMKIGAINEQIYA